jgi:hypothetical protein
MEPQADRAASVAAAVDQVAQVAAPEFPWQAVAVVTAS